MQNEYSAITISIPKVKVSHLEKNIYLYEIDVATRWAKWHLEKKYSEFQQLHKFLQREFNDLPQFPSTLIGYFLGENQDDVAEFKDILEDYLRITSLRKDIINSEYYSEFLQLSKHSQALLVNKPQFDGEFELEERAGEDGKVLVDFYYDESYFIFATGNDSPLEKFNAVLANTKFPWEDEEDAEFILPLGTVQCWICKKRPYKYSRIWARNYPKQVTKLLFNPEAEFMAVGLSDGGLQLFRLYARGRNLYYEVIKMTTAHQDSITGLHLDSVNNVLYSTSIDGWLNVFEGKNGVLIDSIQIGTDVTSMYGDSDHMRLFLALGDGNIQIFSYDYKAKARVLAMVSTPDTGEIRKMTTDNIKNYLFATGYETGNIFIYDTGKSGQQKLTKQIAFLKNKQKIIGIHWIAEKMELIVATETGEVFFWNCVQGKQIYMLKTAEEGKYLVAIHFIPSDYMLITVEKERVIKFWRIPKVWRDVSTELEEEKEIEIRRKVENLHKVREAVKRKEQDSDEDDLACWFMSQSSSEEEESWLNLDF